MTIADNIHEYKKTYLTIKVTDKNQIILDKNNERNLANTVWVIINTSIVEHLNCGGNYMVTDPTTGYGHLQLIIYHLGKYLNNILKLCFRTTKPSMVSFLNSSGHFGLNSGDHPRRGCVVCCFLVRHVTI